MAKFFNKKKLVILLAGATMCLSTAFAVACGEKVEQINITRSNTPQTVYVLGSDLNLSEGKLTVVIGGNKTEIPFTDPEVAITGYDSSKLGNQVLTVAYKGQTTILKVTVVPRIEVANYETGYFVNEPFNAKKGDITITADNGERSTVSIDDETIFVEGFDSTKANEALPLTITYEDEDVSYFTTVNVGIYEVDDIEFKAPNKKAYKSHEEALDVQGGYMALKAEDEALTRYVILNKDMVSGFDLSAATVEHRTTPLNQTLTVEYCGYEKQYDIQIKFSDISLLNLRGDEMDSLNWTSTDVPSDCDEEMGENALEAMRVYFEMVDTDVSRIDDGAVEHVAKVATAYGLAKWQEKFASYSDAFYLTDAGVLSWNCENFDKTVAVYQTIINKDPVMYVDGATLTTIKEKFATSVLFGEELIGDVLSVIYSPDTIDAFIEQLGLMIDLHNTLKDIPVDWTLDMLKTEYADEIYAAWAMLYETKFKATEQRAIYLLTSRWREKNDFFEILYAYYYDLYTDPQSATYGDLTQINAFKDLYLPGELETLYQMALSARSELIYMQQGYRLDASNFMIIYELAEAKKAEILNSDNEMWKTLYNELEFDYLVGNGNGGYSLISFDGLFNQFRRANFGYLYQFNAYLGIEEYEQLWADFTEVVEKIGSQEGYDGSAQYGADVEKLLKDYIALTPKQQFGFISLLHPYYQNAVTMRYPTWAWANDGNGNYANQFTLLIYTYYESILPEETHDVFTELMLASETMAGLSLATPIDTFFSHMDNVENFKKAIMKNNLAAWEEFSSPEVLGWLLNEMETYETKFEPVKENKPIVSEDLTQAELALFGELLNAAYEAYAMMMTYQAFVQQNRANIAIAFYAPMEKVEKLSKQILSSPNPAVRRAYYFEEMVLEGVTMPDKSVQNFGGTMDFLVWVLRESYTNALTGMSYLTASQLVYDVYEELDVKDFLSEASYVFFNYIYMQLVPTYVTDGIWFRDTEKMMNIAKSFREDLTDEQRYFIFVMDSNFQMYRNAMGRFALERNNEIAVLAQQLITVELMYVYAKVTPDAKDEDGKTYYSILQQEYNTLLADYEVFKAEVEAEKLLENPNEQLVKALEDFNTYFGEMYAFYVEKCEAMFSATNE